jgi:predicted transcriptional regulator
MIKPVSVSLETQDLKRLERLAKQDGLSTSYLVRRAIKEYLERQEETEKK